MVLHYQLERLRYNSDQSTAITDVLINRSGRPTAAVRSRWAARPARPAPARAAGRCTPTATKSWSSGLAVPWSDLRSRSPKSWIVWATARMTWTAPLSGRSGSS
jgi:hypothetical protein